jgi:hypothetical protein
VARQWLTGGKVLLASTGGVPGRHWVRRVETGLTEAVGRRKAAGATVFNGGGVAPVVVDVRGGVLQHQCGRGKRDLAPIWGMERLGGRSPEKGKTAAALGKIRCEGEASGGRRWRYGRGNGGEGGGAREGGRSGVGDERVD